jgi:hypothetical protein
MDNLEITTVAVDTILVAIQPTIQILVPFLCRLEELLVELLQFIDLAFNAITLGVSIS